ncbi:hypothetical protein [Ilumatobacter fluminis]|uniref:hypothetical protein n=1 Tax=Ilumatobacter fluminis TaxID=467091 RepID=UPI00105E1985|nr:hypothetical protein [Ilumatobacter fluminis]
MGATVAADAKSVDVVGITGADSRGTDTTCSSSTTLSGRDGDSDGAAMAKPPIATPVIVPTVAAIFQSIFLLFMAVPLGG